MDVESSLEPDRDPNLDAFLLARIAEDKRIAAQAARESGREEWTAGDAVVSGPPGGKAVEHADRHHPARVLAECSAKRRLVLACRDIGPDLGFVGSRPPGMSDFPLPPSDQHQLAALTLALLALPYADHHDYRQEWRP